MTEQLDGDAARWRFDGLRALYLNCTLKPSPEVSHTQGLLDRSRAIMQRHGVDVSVLRAIDHDIATGVWPDMTQHGWPTDARAGHLPAGAGRRHPGALWADLAGRQQLGDEARDRAAVRLLAPAQRGRPVRLLRPRRRLPDHRQRGRRQALRRERALQPAAPRLRIPPQADAGWIGGAGPGPSYLDPGSGGPQNDFTNRNTTFATWNLMHLAKLLKDAGGIPAHGNQRSAWEAGCRFDYDNPEHR